MKIVLLVLLLCASSGHAGVKSLAADFTKISSDSHGRDSCLGRIFFRAPSDIFMTIVFPVDQMIYLSEKNMVIQYPKQKLAMKYTSKAPFTLPFFQALMGAMEGEGAISRSGFSLAGVEKKGDTSETEWIPRKGGHKESPIGSMKVTSWRGRILRFAAYDAKGILKKKVSYGDFQETEFGVLPCRIRSEEMDGKAVLFEEFVLKGLQLNPAVPAPVENWRVPPDFTIKEYQW